MTGSSFRRCEREEIWNCESRLSASTVCRMDLLARGILFARESGILRCAPPGDPNGGWRCCRTPRAGGCRIHRLEIVAVVCPPCKHKSRSSCRSTSSRHQAQPISSARSRSAYRLRRRCHSQLCNCEPVRPAAEAPMLLRDVDHAASIPCLTCATRRRRQRATTQGNRHTVRTAFSPCGGSEIGPG